jgi:hypothetical protein
MFFGLALAWLTLTFNISLFYPPTEAIRTPRRFQQYLEDRDLELAACLIPRFKMDWVPDNDLRDELKAALVREASRAVPLDSPTSPPSPSPSSSRGQRGRDAEQATGNDDDDPFGLLGDQEEDDVSAAPVPELSAEDEFFGFRPQPQHTVLAPGESPEEEVQRFLSRPSQTETVEECYAKDSNGNRRYPRLARLFLKYNTALPSSATVERLFWRAGHNLSDLRNRIADVTFQKEVLLKANSSFWKF